MAQACDEVLVGPAGSGLTQLQHDIGIEQEHQLRSAGQARSRARGCSSSASSTPAGKLANRHPIRLTDPAPWRTGVLRPVAAVGRSVRSEHCGRRTLGRQNNDLDLPTGGQFWRTGSDRTGRLHRWTVV